MSYNNDSLYTILMVKLDLVRAQTNELQARLQTFIDKISSDVNAVADEKLPANRIAEINSQLDAFLALLMEKWPKINYIGTHNTDEDYNHGKLPVSEGQKGLLTEISELVQRVEKVESDLIFSLNRHQIDERNIQTAQTQIFRMQENLKTVDVEKLNSDKEFNSRFELLNNRVKLLEEDESLHSLKKQFHEKLTDDSEVKKHETRLNTIQDLIQNLQMNCSEMDKVIQKQSDEVQTLKKSVRSDINHCQNKLDHASKTSSDFQTDLLDKVETALDRLVISEEESSSERNELKKKLSIFESKRQTDVMKLNSLFKQVCHMISTKVDPLCRLQTILNKHRATLKLGNNFHTLMTAVSTQVNNLLPRVQKLANIERRDIIELGTRKSSVGFTAYFHSQVKVTKGSNLKFTDVRYKSGNLYDPLTGMFTATHEGVYMAAVTLSQSSVGTMGVQIIQNSFTNAIRKVVCKAETNNNCGNSCGIGIASIKAGDILFVTVKDAQEDVCLSGYSSFSCVLIM